MREKEATRNKSFEKSVKTHIYLPKRVAFNPNSIFKTRSSPMNVNQ